MKKNYILTMIFALLGISQVWGETCYVFEDLMTEDGYVANISDDVIYTTSNIGNTDGIDTIRFEYWAGDRKIKLQYSTDSVTFNDIPNSEKAKFKTKNTWRGKTGNGQDIYVVVSDVDLQKSIQYIRFRTVSGGVHWSNYDYKVRKIQVSKVPTVKLDKSSDSFPKIAVGANTSRIYTISTWNVKSAVNVAISGDNASLFSYELSEPSGSCPIERTLKITYSPNVAGEHSARVTVSSNEAGNVTLDVTGAADAEADPVYTCNIAEEYYVEDEEIDLAALWTSTSAGAITYSIASFEAASGNQEGAKAPAIRDNRYLSFGQAGALNLKLTQATEGAYRAGEDTKTVTISRRLNTLYVKGVAEFAETIHPDAVLENVEFTADNSDYTNSPIEWAVKDGVEFAVFDPEAKTITANYKLGTASWTLAQAENYKYKSAEATFSVTVAQEKEAVSYVLQPTDSTGWATYGDVQYQFDDPGVTLYYEIMTTKNWGVSTNVAFHLLYSADGENWTQEDIATTADDEWQSFTKTLSDDIRYVRFNSTFGAGGFKHVRHVSVTRKTYLTAEIEDIKVPVLEEAERTLVVNYGIANGGDLKIVCDNDKFTLGSNTIANVNNSNGTANIPVTFAAQEEGGVYVANIVIYNNVYRKELTLTASVRKTTPVISWENIEMVYGEEAALNATVDADEIEIKYAVVDESDVIHIANGQVFADKTGNAQIRAYVEESDKYNAAEKIIDVTVNKAQQTINWEQELEGLEVNDEIQLEAIASSGLEVTFVSLDESIARIDENNVLYAYQEGEVTIKAVQAGNDNYESAEMERKVTISQATDTRKSQVIIWNNQTLEVDMAEGAEIVVLTAVAEPSGYDVTYTSSDITIAKIGVMDDGEMIYYYVEPVRVGKVQITASQEGDDTWKAAIDVTKEFEIINSLDPETGVENIEQAEHATKILLNGQILILRDGKIYDLRGQRVE